MKPNRVYTSSIYINLGGSQARSVDEQISFDLGADPVSKRFSRDKRSSSKADREAIPEFIIRPRRQFVEEGKTAKFKASFDGSPDTELHWIRNDTILKNDRKHRIYQEKELHWLEICSITAEDGGTYCCRIQNSSGNAEVPVELEVYVKPTSLASKMEGFVAPQVDVHLTDQYAAPGDRSVIMECKFSNAIDSTTIWYKDGRKLNSGFFAKQTFDGRLARLTLNRVTLKEGGVYECVAQSTGGEAKTKATLTVKTPGTRSIPPKFVSPLSDQTLKQGDKLTLQSRVTGFPTPTIKWYKNREEIRSTKTITTEFDGTTARLKMSEVTTSDSDVYKCVAENDAGRDQIKANITVRAATSAATDDFKEPPIFVRELHDMEADDGDRVELVVEVKGTPPVDIVWLHKDQEISYEDPVFKLISENQIHKLIIPEVSPEDNGRFVCEIYNKFGDTDTFCNLRVRENVSRKCMNNSNYSYLKSGSQKRLKNTDFESESEKSLQISQADSGYDDTSLQKPDFILKPRSVEVNEGQSAIFLCRTRGNPPPKIEWKKQGETIHQDSRHKITYGDDCILEIKRTTSRDSGSYTCVLTNPAGTVTMETTLVVKTTKTEQEAPSDFKSTFRRISKQEETKQSTGPKLTNSQDRVEKTISTPVIRERGAIGSRFSPVTQNNPVLQSPGSKPQSSSLSEKIERFQKLEQKSPQSPKGFDFRSVLKPKQNVDSKVKQITSNLGSTDGASRNNLQDVLSQRRQLQQREVTPSRSKTAQDISSPSWKSQSPIQKSGENSAHKSVFNNHAKNETEKVDFRSVLKKTENSSVKEVQSFESSTQNKVQGEIVKEVNNNISNKPEISRWRRDLTTETSVRIQPAGNTVNDRKLIADKLKSETKDQISDKNQTLVKDGNTENDIQHVWSHRKTNNFEQQNQNINRETPPPGFPRDLPSNNISSNTRARNENYESSETPQEVNKSPFVSKLQEQTAKQDDKSPNNVYPNNSVKKSEVWSNHENSNARNRNVNSRFLGNSEIEEKEKLAETNQTSEKSVLQEKVKVVSKEKEEISLVDKQSKEASVNLQKRGSTFESPIKLDVKEDYKSILTKRKSEPDLKEKQLRDLRAIERFSMMSNRKKTEKSENKIPVPESTVKEDVSVGSESIVTPNVKSRGLTMKFNEKEEARGGVGKYQSLNGSIEPGKSNKSSFGSDRKIIDSNIPRDEPRSVLKRRRSSSSFNKNDKLSPTGLDPSADTRLRQPPSFQTVLQNQSVSEGESVTMECHVIGFPKPEVTWYMKDTQIKPSKFFRMTYEDNMARLVIAGAYPEDVGTYSCVATNSSGTERCSCHLFVQECPSTTSNNQSDEEMPPDTPTQKTPLDPPKSLDLDDEDEEEPKTPKLVAPYINEINPTDQTVIAGHKAVFQGSFTSDGKTEVRWYKGTEEIHTCEKRTVSTTEHLSRLTIHNVQPVDGGAYQIVAENKAGSVSAVLSLSVQDVPDPPVGKPYASEVSLYSIILSWCGPAYDGGSQVTGYKVEICKAEEETWDTLSSTCHSTSFSIDNLEAHTPYFFRVSAKNKNGMSKPSEMSNVVVTKDRRRSVRLSVESDDVFLTSPTSSGSLVSPFSTTEEDLPFSPRVINISTTRKFEDDYDLKDGVGKGKFGSVSKCTEKSSGRTFAAKIVKCRSSKEKDNIRQEVEIMNQLTHPKLVLLWDAFETARSMVLVMEYVAGGELFDRVVDEDLELSERDCVHFVRQICEGVQYMHTKSIMHLDLKPENILCVTKDSNLIKIIDFGLARPCKEDEGLRVMFGTPEFIAPEVVNYEVIGFPTDIWSLGVICYVLLSGLSPFMGDSDVETLANVTRGDFDFDDDAFDEISDKAKDFIEKSLQKNKNKRPTVEQCLEHKWLAQAERNSCKKLRQSLRNLKQFMARRKWQKMGNAIRAVGRMSSAMQKLQKSRSDSTSSAKSDSSDNTSQSPIDSSSTVSSTEDKNSGKLSSRDVAAKETPSTNGKTIPKNENSVPLESKVQRDLNKNLTHRQTEIDRDTSKHVNMFSKPVHSEPDPNTYHDKSRTNRQSTEKENKQIHNQSFSKREKLKFLKEMVDCEAFEGDIVRFDVQISGDKGLNIEWYYEDTMIKEDRQHSFSEVNSENGEFSLIIRNVNENNDGEYMCKVIDSSGEITCFAELSVLGSGAF